jgi:transposase
MIVIGTDTHKRTHTCAAVSAATGRLAGELTAPARVPGFGELLAWGRGLGDERIWAIEDCRHVSGPLERFLVAARERLVRVPPKLTGQSRRGQRTPGKSDAIDALAVARAALREGPETLPAAHLDEEALELKLLLDHARTWSGPARRTSTGCAGTSMTSGPTSRSPPGPSTARSGSTASRGGSPAPDRAPGSGSPASW